MADRITKQLSGMRAPLDDEELDAVKTLLVSLLMKNTPLDRDEIYAYIFGEGRRIIWN